MRLIPPKLNEACYAILSNVLSNMFFSRRSCLKKIKAQNKKKPVTEVLIQNVPPESTSEFESQIIELETNR